MSEATAQWEMVGAVAPGGLLDARLQLHHAAQLAASAGATFLEARPDDSHPNLGWNDQHRALLGHTIPAPQPFRVGLKPGELALVVVDAGEGDGAEVARLSLAGCSIEESMRWLAAAVAARGARVPESGLKRTTYEIPSHAVGTGAFFAMGDQRPFEEAARWFANGHHALSDLVERSPEQADVRVWPHHFDVGALLVLSLDDAGGLASSIGVGMSPGDDYYAEPYWYVSPWPYPEAATLPAAPAGGRWHSRDFTSAVLTGSVLVEGGPADGQARRLRTFLDEAVAAGRALLT